ncbi:MAG TPA: amidase family protein [Gemmatimonadaceae bacterium]|nr:amidase family protein [Gemmatimonadaceae bacterium]
MVNALLHAATRGAVALILALGAVVGRGSAQGSPTVDHAVVEGSISDLQQAMASGRLTAVQLVRAFRARIAAYDQQRPALNAMIRLNPNAERDAAALDRERQAGKVRGPLHGIPIVLKDNYDTYDMPTSASSLALAVLQPVDDAFIVRRLREAGAVILGKTNMHELAAGITSVSSLGGQTRNPYDPRRCPGGSSGGTAAAVAASFAVVGWGSDTCGSIRIPAAYGSLFGLRPTSGLVSRDGVIPLSHTQDVTGPLARTASDLAIALDVSVGRDSADAVTRALDARALPRFVEALDRDALRGARLGILRNLFRDTDADIGDTVRAAARAMGALGAEIVDVTIPDFDSLLAASSVINYEFKWDLIDYLSRVPNAPVKSLREIIDHGMHHDALDATFRVRDTVQTRDSEGYRKAVAKQDTIRHRLIALFDSLRLDALVYPTMQRRPAIVGEPQAGSTCQLSSHCGFPALSLPAGFTSDGLPVGLELLGRPFSDTRLVAFAYAFEQAPGGVRRRPPATTPVLNDARSPMTVTYTARAGSARARLTYDVARSELRYDVSVAPAAVARSQGVVLRRTDAVAVAAEASSRRRVVHRLAGPGMAVGSGVFHLGDADRRALSEGRLWMVHVTSDAPLGLEGPLQRTMARAP